MVAYYIKHLIVIATSFILTYASAYVNLILIFSCQYAFLYLSLRENSDRLWLLSHGENCISICDMRVQLRVHHCLAVCKSYLDMTLLHKVYKALNYRY